MSMLKQLRDEMYTAIARVVGNEGSPVSPTASVWGWKDNDATSHINGWEHWDSQLHKRVKNDKCQWVISENKELNVTETTVFESHDSLNGFETIMVEVGPYHCECGKYSDVTLRYEGTIGSFLPRLFEDPSFVA